MTQIVDLATHPEPYVSVPELAAYWGVSQRAVYYLIAKGALPALRIGRTLRVPTDVAQAFGRIEEAVMGPIASSN